jgi:hypothetical protein
LPHHHKIYIFYYIIKLINFIFYFKKKMKTAGLGVSATTGGSHPPLEVGWPASHP